MPFIPDLHIIPSLAIMVLAFFALPMVLIFSIMSYVIRRLAENHHVVKDMYKFGLPEIPTQGGLVIILIATFSLSIFSLIFAKSIPAINYSIIMVVVLFAFFGQLDDLINIGRAAKLVLLYYCSYPLIPFILTTSVLLPILGPVDFSSFYPQIIITTYVPVVSNLVNMHSGFNGLAPGLSLILLLTLIIKAFFFGNISNALFIVCLAGALAGYFWFEKYPSRIFWGNIGALSIGAGIGAMIVTQGFIVSGFIMLIPHTVNFLMYLYWRMNSHRYPPSKFGKISDDGTLIIPNPLTLKWLLPYYTRMSEQKATTVMFGITSVFCVIGFCIPG